MDFKGDTYKINIPDILYYSYYTLGPTTVSPYHSHTYYEFTYLYECKGIYHIDDRRYKVKRGDIILFPPGCKHEEIIPEGDQFNIFVIGLEGFDFSSIPGFYHNFNMNIPFLDTGDHVGAISACCEEIRKEILSAEVGYRHIIKALIEKLLVLIIRSKSNKSLSSSSERESLCIDYSDKKSIVDRTKQYIDFYYSSKISLEDIAHNIYLSPAYIIKIFKEVTGETPINYLIKVRINKAKELLSQEKVPLSEVAEMVGYEDIVHFSKLFKKYTGFSPKQFVKNKIENSVANTDRL